MFSHYPTRLAHTFRFPTKTKYHTRDRKKKELLSTINILLDNDSLFIHSVLAAIKALGFLKRGNGGKEGKLLTLCSLKLGSWPRGERVPSKTRRLGSYKPPMLPDIWGFLTGLRQNACWVVQHTGSLHTSGSGVNSLSIFSIKEAFCLGQILECLFGKVLMSDS